MNSSTGDIYDWFKKYFPSKLNGDFDVDQLFEIYKRGIECGVGKFKDGDIISYNWTNKESTLVHTAVAIYNYHIIDEYKIDPFSNSSYNFFFYTYIGCFDLYSENPDIIKGAKVVYMEDVRIASEEERLKFFDNLRNYKY